MQTIFLWKRCECLENKYYVIVKNRSGDNLAILKSVIALIVLCAKFHIFRLSKTWGTSFFCIIYSLNKKNWSEIALNHIYLKIGPRNWYRNLAFFKRFQRMYNDIKWKVNNYLGINLKLTHNFNLFRCSLAVIKLIYRLKISPF